jgi:hypothetical protein
MQAMDPTELAAKLEAYWQGRPEAAPVLGTITYTAEMIAQAKRDGFVRRDKETITSEE